MNQRLRALRDLLAPEQGELFGVVLRATDRRVSLSTQRGLREVPRESFSLKVGDEVVIDGSRILRKLNREQALPVYFV